MAISPKAATTIFDGTKSLAYSASYLCAKPKTNGLIDDKVSCYNYGDSNRTGAVTFYVATVPISVDAGTGCQYTVSSKSTARVEASANWYNGN